MTVPLFTVAFSISSLVLSRGDCCCEVLVFSQDPTLSKNWTLRIRPGGGIEIAGVGSVHGSEKYGPRFRKILARGSGEFR